MWCVWFHAMPCNAMHVQLLTGWQLSSFTRNNASIFHAFRYYVCEHWYSTKCVWMCSRAMEMKGLSAPKTTLSPFNNKYLTARHIKIKWKSSCIYWRCCFSLSLSIYCNFSEIGVSVNVNANRTHMLHAPLQKNTGTLMQPQTWQINVAYLMIVCIKYRWPLLHICTQTRCMSI